MTLTAKEKLKKQWDRLLLDKYITCYADLLNDVHEIDAMLRAGGDVNEIMAKWKELLVCDDARWHLWSAEQEKLRKEHLRLVRKARKARAVSTKG